MNKKYEVAKKQGLNWQALLIEETQTELKVEIQKMVLLQKSYFEINKKVVELIESAIKELENENLKNTAKPTLYAYATRIYNYLRQTYQNLNLFGLTALIAVANRQANQGQIRTVNEIVNSFSGSAYNRAIPLELFAKDYMKMIKERVDYLTKIEAKEDYTSRVNLRNIAEMQIRQERHEEEISELIESGVELVWIVPHANCSERCEHWQGKLYSLNHTYGTIDGISYEPLENATDIYERTKSGKVYKNGCISGFNCFDKETEVLTNNGWKLFKDLRSEDLIYTLNTETKLTEWQRPLHYYQKLHNGEMIRLKSFTSDLLVTPNHNMIYYTQRRKDLRFKEAQNITLSDYQYAGQEWKGKKQKFVKIGNTKIETKVFCRLLGYWLADGSIQDNTSIKIAQQNNDEMWSNLQELPFKLWRDKDKIIIRDKALRDMFKQLGTCETKYVYSWIKELSKEYLREFLEAYNFTDGYTRKETKINSYIRKPHKTLFTTSKQMCADLCEIALKCGYRPKVEVKRQKGKQIQFKNGVYTMNYDLYIIHLNRFTSFKFKTIESVNYNDYVYCVEVPNHTLLVKRNGYIQWCGNCRHTLQPYNKGNKPIEIPRNVIDKQREINAKQRYFERGVREWKEKALLYKGIDKKLYDFARVKAKQWNERYIAYSKQNDVAYYPSRTDIL